MVMTLAHKSMKEWKRLAKKQDKELKIFAKKYKGTLCLNHAGELCRLVRLRYIEHFDKEGRDFGDWYWQYQSLSEDAGNLDGLMNQPVIGWFEPLKLSKRAYNYYDEQFKREWESTYKFFRTTNQNKKKK